MDVANFCSAAEAYPPPTTSDGARVAFSYGTAGFRTDGALLASTVFRCGALAAVRSRVTGRATGLVITASHNPERDNGVKLVDCTGGTLPVSWEAHAEALANADGADALARVLRALLALSDPAESLHPPPPPGSPPSPPPPHVFLARDTRPTGPDLAAAAEAGAVAIGAAVTNLGEMTTPQLHYVVYAAYRGWPRAEADYYARLAAGFEALTTAAADAAAPPSKTPAPAAAIVVDCADGVGAAKLAALAEATGGSLALDLRNATRAPGALNDRVGADYVQKERVAPSRGGFDALAPGTRCVSVDGDADRLVYFDVPEPEAEGKNDGGDDSKTATMSASTTIRRPVAARLFDGDKIAALVATRVAELLARIERRRSVPNASAEPSPSGASSPASSSFLPGPALRVGVVQTAYANGASTRYVAETLGLATACAKTGVKHLHPEAETFDVGVYFEANGHGTALFSDETLARLEEARRTLSAEIEGHEDDEDDEDASEQHAEARDALGAFAELLALSRAINPAVGDALSGVLVVEAVLRAKGWTLSDWDAMYADLPSAQVKVTVADRGVIVTEDAERRASAPAAMQAAIDRAVTEAGGRARAFARPSGTEDVVRVYAEAETREGVEALARDVARAVYDHAGGTGERP
jgi:phosphoacetylglucosamine mutase